jgi:transcriptional regulator with XRE-family HTH domain
MSLHTPQNLKAMMDQTKVSAEKLEEITGVAAALIESFAAGKAGLSEAGQARVFKALIRSGAEFPPQPPKPKAAPTREIKPEQCKALREIAEWSLDTLGQKSGYAPNVIEKFEEGKTPLTPEAQVAIIDAFRKEGYALAP